MWLSGTASAPGANQVIVNTGPIVDVQRPRVFVAFFNATLAATFVIQWLDGGSSVKQKQEISVVANGAVEFPRMLLDLDSGDSVRVLMKAGILGDVSASLIWNYWALYP